MTTLNLLLYDSAASLEQMGSTLVETGNLVEHRTIFLGPVDPVDAFDAGFIHAKRHQAKLVGACVLGLPALYISQIDSQNVGCSG